MVTQVLFPPHILLQCPFSPLVFCNPESVITLEMEKKRDISGSLWAQEKENYDTTILIRKIYKVI